MAANIFCEVVTLPVAVMLFAAIFATVVFPDTLKLPNVVRLPPTTFPDAKIDKVLKLPTLAEPLTLADAADILNVEVILFALTLLKALILFVLRLPTLAEPVTLNNPSVIKLPPVIFAFATIVVLEVIVFAAKAFATVAFSVKLMLLADTFCCVEILPFTDRLPNTFAFAPTVNKLSTDTLLEVVFDVAIMLLVPKLPTFALPDANSVPVVSRFPPEIDPVATIVPATV